MQISCELIGSKTGLPWKVAAGFALLFGCLGVACGQAPGSKGVETSVSAQHEPPLQPLLNFKESDFKFSLPAFMNVLRDRRHEGWVLAAYPDPKTKRPLIGAGFSLDVEAMDHPQRDPLNPHPFLEPSSAQLWQAAGLAPERLERILDQYERDMRAWSTRTYRRKIRMQTLSPQVTEEEATRLLRISAIQAIYNARAYCRGFDDLTGPQQMALSQLVFQMGVNLEEFVQFLGTLNGNSIAPVLSTGLNVEQATDGDRWKRVQSTLIDSQWARLYRERASSVIAMFDPAYVQDPSGATRRIEAVLHPPATHRRRRRTDASLETASYRGHGARSPQRKARATHHKRRLA